MSDTNVSSWQKSLPALFVFQFLLLAYPVLSFLWRRSYDVLTPETGILFLAILTFSAFASILVWKAPQPARSLWLVLLTCLALMVQFNLRVAGLALCGLLGLLLALRVKDSYHRYGIPVLLALIAGAYFDAVRQQSSNATVRHPVSQDAGLPPVVHIMLDAFIGTEGLPPYPATGILKDSINSFFEKYGFRVFSRAYTRYVSTGNSVYSGFNFRHDNYSQYAQEVLNKQEHHLKPNALFDAVVDAGYGLNIFQTEFIDFCENNKDSLEICWSYQQPNVSAVPEFSSLALKVRMLYGVLFSQSSLLKEKLRSRGWIHNWHIPYHDPRLFQRLSEGLSNEPGGKYFFSHLLLPHGPYSYQHDCSINMDSPVWARHPGFEDEGILSPEIYEIRYMQYFEQVDCALSSLGQVFDEMQNSGWFDESIIVLHGDHGSLIAEHLPDLRLQESLTSADYRAHYSTLFAIKLPGGKFELDRRVLPLSLLLEEFARTVQLQSSTGNAPQTFMSDTTVSPEKLNPYVYLLSGPALHRVDIDIFAE